MIHDVRFGFRVKIADNFHRPFFPKKQSEEPRCLPKLRGMLIFAELPAGSSRGKEELGDGTNETHTKN